MKLSSEATSKDGAKPSKEEAAAAAAAAAGKAKQKEKVQTKSQKCQPHLDPHRCMYPRAPM